MWFRLQAIVLSLYHLQVKSGGLARNGFFHWRHHIVSFIDRNWNVLFPNDRQRRKKWVGTVSGRLSHYSCFFFLSGSKTVFNKPAWWTLMYPKITPLVTASVCKSIMWIVCKFMWTCMFLVKVAPFYHPGWQETHPARQSLLLQGKMQNMGVFCVQKVS